jgi:nucleoside-diphosphate kinase
MRFWEKLSIYYKSSSFRKGDLMQNSGHSQTLVLIKPDALKISATGYIFTLLNEFNTGLYFAGMKIAQVSNMLAAEHYAEHRGKGFYPSLLEYIAGKLHFPGQPEKQKVIALVYQGPNAVAKVREIAGPTNPINAREQKPGCIRSYGALIPVKNAEGAVIDQRIDNLIHASATDPEAEREIKLWFKPNEIPTSLVAYAVKQCDTHIYYKDKKIGSDYLPGSICLLAPGDIVWESDLDILNKISSGAQAPGTLELVAAKYLLNDSRQS